MFPIKDREYVFSPPCLSLHGTIAVPPETGDSFLAVSSQIGIEFLTW
jgi:hypothetical protein